MRWAIVVGGVIGALAAIAAVRSHSRRALSGSFDMLRIIAAEARTPAEYARRAEAWNATEAKPRATKALIDAYVRAHRGANRRKLVALIREAEGARHETKERLWGRVAKGLR